MKLKSLAVVFGVIGMSAAAMVVDAATLAMPKQSAAIQVKVKPVFTVQDCALWKGGEGHVNDNVPAIYSQHVEAMLEFYDNMPLPEAMRAIETYCDKGGFK